MLVVVVKVEDEFVFVEVLVPLSALEFGHDLVLVDDVLVCGKVVVVVLGVDDVEIVDVFVMVVKVNVVVEIELDELVALACSVDDELIVVLMLDVVELVEAAWLFEKVDVISID